MLNPIPPRKEAFYPPPPPYFLPISHLPKESWLFAKIEDFEKMPFGAIFAIISPPSLRVPPVEDWLKVLVSYTKHVLYLKWYQSSRSNKSLPGQTKSSRLGLKGPPWVSYSKCFLGGIGFSVVGVEKEIDLETEWEREREREKERERERETERERWPLSESSTIFPP